VGQDGLPWPISRGRVLVIKSTTVRLNYDHTITPTTLLHLGAGVQRYRNPDSGPPQVTDFDAAGLLGVVGAPGTGFPRLSGLGNSTFGGMSRRDRYIESRPVPAVKPTALRNSPTSAARTRLRRAANGRSIPSPTSRTRVLRPTSASDGGQTAQPLYGTINLPAGTGIGNGFASFLLGYFNSASIGNQSAPQYRRSTWSFFVQDTWKASRKLTLDIGLRYDLQKPERELWGRQASFRPNPDQSEDGHPGCDHL
jgi:outer membrane receptor protein involved in Fe transport